MAQRVFRDRRDAGRVPAGLLTDYRDRDVVVVLGLPRGGVMILDHDVVHDSGVGPEDIEQVAEEESRELARREQAYRGSRPMTEVAGKTVLVVEDGLATGASMRATIRALRELGPVRLVVAVPAASNSYRDFGQTNDEEVRDLLRAASSAGTGDRRDLRPRTERPPALPGSRSASCSWQALRFSGQDGGARTLLRSPSRGLCI